MANNGTEQSAEAPEEADEAYLARVNEIISALPSLKAASEMTGYSAKQIAKWRDGRAKVPFRQMATLCAAAGRSLSWLATGQEPVQDTEPAHEADDVSRIPLLDVVASAGGGRFNVDPAELDHLPFPKLLIEDLGARERDLRFMESHGDSMYPTIADPALLLVDVTVRALKRDGIYVLVVDGDVRIKRVMRGVMGGATLYSDNETYKPELIRAGELDRLEIAGQVIWAGGKL